MRLVCRIAILGYGLLYAGALGVFVVYGWGLFGHRPEALAGIYLVMLGYPWFHVIGAFPEPLWPWLGMLAPLGNLGLMVLICRWLGRRARAG